MFSRNSDNVIILKNGKVTDEDGFVTNVSAKTHKLNVEYNGKEVKIRGLGHTAWPLPHDCEDETVTVWIDGCQKETFSPTEKDVGSIGLWIHASNQEGEPSLLMIPDCTQGGVEKQQDGLALYDILWNKVDKEKGETKIETLGWMLRDCSLNAATVWNESKKKFDFNQKRGYYDVTLDFVLTSCKGLKLRDEIVFVTKEEILQEGGPDDIAINKHVPKHIRAWMAKKEIKH